jgi:hypothetical protein
LPFMHFGIVNVDQPVAQSGPAVIQRNEKIQLHFVCGESKIHIDLHGEHPISQNKQAQPNPTQPKRMRSAAQLPPCRSSPPLPLLLRVPLRTSRYCRFDLSSPPPPSTSPLLRFPPPTPREPSDKHRCQCGGASPAPSSAPPRRRRDAAPPRPSDAPRRCLPSTGAPTETSAGSRRSRRRRRGRGSRSRSRR